MLAQGSSAWATTADVATTFGTVIALLGVIVTFVFTLRSERWTRRGQELERIQTQAAAERSEAAAALTEEYTRRVVEALETMASNGPGSVVLEGSAGGRLPGVRWTLEHHDGYVYLLTNVGGQGAEEVTVAGHESLVLRAPDPQDVAPGEAITFFAMRTLATSDSTITVAWREPSNGERRQWRYPLPPRR